MTYGYIRVSTDHQTVENQRFEIERFCEAQGLAIDSWIEENISGTVEPKKRKLGKLLKRMAKGDIIICAELSRLGRTLFMIMGILNLCMEREVQVWTLKDGYRLGDNISSKVLAFAFGLAAEIERDLISKRTKEALARKKAEGGVLGCPKGVERKCALDGKEEEIRKLLSDGVTIVDIAKKMRISPTTVSRFAKKHELGEPLHNQPRLAGREDEIASLLRESSIIVTARQLGVSDTTLRTFIRNTPSLEEFRPKPKEYPTGYDRLFGREDEIQTLIRYTPLYKLAKHFRVGCDTLKKFIDEHTSIKRPTYNPKGKNK